jgi:hypothetical protein
LNDVVDLLFGGVVGHVHNHGDDPSFPLPPKTKAAIYRGFGGIFELFSIFLATRSDSAPPPQMETNSGQTGGTC